MQTSHAVKAYLLERLSLFLVVIAITTASAVKVAFTYHHLLAALAHAIQVQLQ